MARIACLGMGAMGSRMAARLLAAGHEVAVWNRTARAAQLLAASGGRPAASPAEAARDADIVLSMVRDDDASRIVWTGDDGAQAAMRADAIAVECSTLSLGWVRELSEKMSEVARQFLDAPVAGSRPQAESGELIFLVGGCSEAFAAGALIFDCLGKTAHHVGGNGAGTAAKLAVNSMLAVQAVWIGETVAMLERAGLNAGDIMAAALKTPVFGPAAQGLAASIITRDFEPRFPVELARKDVGYALAAGAEMPIAEAAFASLSRAVEAGLGGQQLTAVAKIFNAVPER
ncbi:MAG: NAD(P)-dependent oxidoreductase [Rhizobiaceae bacterium]|nr:NAD(P)-dependent oxidoreductase [Rhizobiaceae bacterium]